MDFKEQIVFGIIHGTIIATDHEYAGRQIEITRATAVSRFETAEIKGRTIVHGFSVWDERRSTNNI